METKEIIKRRETLEGYYKDKNLPLSLDTFYKQRCFLKSDEGKNVACITQNWDGKKETTAKIFFVDGEKQAVMVKLESGNIQDIGVYKEVIFKDGK